MTPRPLRLEVHDHRAGEEAAAAGSGGAPSLAARLEEFAGRAVAAVLGRAGPHDAVLAALDTVEVNLVGDEVIADLHGRYLGDPTATDVITFPHGEIFISVDTAERCGRRFGHGTDREAALYLVHALLHLNGHEDADPDEASRMAAAQEAILDQLWPTAD